MRCKKCGTEVQGQGKYCPNCGNQIIDDTFLVEARSTPAQNRKSTNKVSFGGKNIRNLIFIFLGVILLVISILARFGPWYGAEGYSDVLSASTNIENIATVNGNTIDEIFYQNMGTIALENYTMMLELQSTILRIWQTLNILSLFCGLVMLNIGVTGLIIKRKTT